MKYKIQEGKVIFENGREVDLDKAITALLKQEAETASLNELYEFIQKVNDSEEDLYKVLRKLLPLFGVHYHTLKGKKSVSDTVKQKLQIAKQYGIEIMQEIRIVGQRFGLGFSDEISEALDRLTEQKEQVIIAADSESEQDSESETKAE